MEEKQYKDDFSTNHKPKEIVEIPDMDESKVNVFVLFVNPYQIKALIELHKEYFSLELPGVVKFVDNDFQLNNRPMDLLGNYTNIFTDGKVLSICWVASVEDKSLCLLKIDNLFRPEYRFCDVETKKEINRLSHRYQTTWAQHYN